MKTACHPERSECSAKRSIHAVEGPLSCLSEHLSDASCARTVLSRRYALCVRSSSIPAALLLLTTLASAQTLTGTVKNSTTGKPSAGDEVVLLKLGQGMDEAGRTKTDAKGKFSFKLDDDKSPHLVRAIHQGVTYHRMAPPGTTSVELEVYDVAKKLDGLDVVADIVRLQVEQGQLTVVRELGVQNASKPPRTQMNERNVEFYIPDGAQIIPDSATATTENGNPLKTNPVPEGEKNRYAFIFPLRPGLTRFEVAYQMPYSGSANVDPKSVYPLQHFVVMLPKTMQFTAATDSAGFKSVPYPQEPDAIVQVASNTTVGQNLAFKVSGQGVLQGPQQESNTGQGANARRARRTTAPAAGSARLSTLLTLCRNTAGRFSEASRQHCSSAEFLWPCGNNPQPARWHAKRLLRPGERRYRALCIVKMKKTNTDPRHCSRRPPSRQLQRRVPLPCCSMP